MINVVPKALTQLIGPEATYELKLVYTFKGYFPYKSLWAVQKRPSCANGKSDKFPKIGHGFGPGGSGSWLRLLYMVRIIQ